MPGLRAVLALLLIGTGVARAQTPPPSGQLPDTAEPLHYALNFRIDPAAAGFSASSEIRLRLKQADDHLWLHAQGLRVSGVELHDAQGVRHPATFVAAAGAGLARIGFGRRLPAQELRLTIAYAGDYNAQLEGLFKTVRAGKPYVATQMEPISARRAFPCFDEPRFKATFDVQIEAPPDQRVVANAAQSGQEVIAGGWQRTRFRTTPRLPTYLIAVAVGPWDVVAAEPIAPTRWRTRPIPLRGLAPQGEGHRLKEMLAATPALVTAMEDYFGYPYAFDKLDLLAVPDFSAGAMENPGLIVYRESLLLLDANTPASLRRTAFEVNAHELAHQWFGNTVTMPWWDDLWLNEAFATWLAARVSMQLRPANRAELDGIVRAQQAMATDSLASARRVRQPIRDNGDIEGAFDALTYAKGAAVLGMFEAWLGEPVFRGGLRSYMKKHAFASARSDDLIDALAEAGDKDRRLGQAMGSFLDQAGVPLVRSRLDCKDGKARLLLRQQRYLPLGSAGDARQRWGIPFCVRLGRAGKTDIQCQLFDTETAEMPVDGDCPDWYLPNAQARGYYRVAMPAAELARLTQAAGGLDAREQLAFADAVKAGFERGEIDAAGVLAALEPLAGSSAREVALALQDELVWIRRNLADDATRAAIDRYAARLYLPRLRALGYLRRAGEPAEAALLRADLAELLGRKMENAEVRAALLRQGRAVLAGDGGGRLQFGAANYDLLGSVLSVTVQELGSEAIERLIAELARTASGSLRTTMVMALGATTDVVQGERVREFALSDAVRVGETTRLLGVHQYEPRNRAAIWRWFQRRYDQLLAHTPAFSHGDLPELIGEGWCEQTQATRMREFFGRRAGEVDGIAQGLNRAGEAILLCEARRQKHGAASLRDWAAR